MRFCAKNTAKNCVLNLFFLIISPNFPSPALPPDTQRSGASGAGEPERGAAPARGAPGTAVVRAERGVCGTAGAARQQAPEGSENSEKIKKFRQKFFPLFWTKNVF